MSEKKGFNRRDFLKVLSAGSGLVASGCGKDLPEKIIPYVIHPDEVVAGNAVWYSGTCNECSAGCGVLVRTKEGRALKVEGNPKHPVNRGGLCSLGQSSLQAQYDPDRVREPLKRKIGESFKNTTWEDAVSEVAKKLSSSKRTVFFTKPLSGSEAKILKEFTSKLKNSEVVQYELLGNDSLYNASGDIFGKGVKVDFDFSKAEVVLGVGADYLETWMSPVKFTKDFSSKRVPERNKGRISKVYHVEPRLSLTASNADTWLKNKPGTELDILKAVLKSLIASSKVSLNSDAKAASEKILKGFDLEKALKNADVKEETLKSIVTDLTSVKESLVVAGGASLGAQAKEVSAVALLLNSVLGNIGRSVKLYKSSSDFTVATVDKLKTLVTDMQAKAIGAVVFIDTNPLYSLPKDLGFEKALASVGSVTSISTTLDETAKFADTILPLSKSFETWSDSEPMPGVFAINQPAMQPLYKTQGLGDIILSLDASKDLEGAGQFSKKFTNFKDYLDKEWKDILGEAGFKDKFENVIAEGGHFGVTPTYLNIAGNFSGLNSSYSFTTSQSAGLMALAFPTVRYQDGKGANRAWLHEVPDPMTTTVWGSWIEIHPDTAERFGITHGQVIQIKSEHGAIDAPAYVSKHIHPSLVASPLGLGHDSYGRFANGVGVNAIDLVGASSVKDGGISLIASGVEIRPSVNKDELVAVQFSDSQLDRGFVRTVSEEKYLKSVHDEHGDSHGGHAGGHHDRLALGPREEPAQMYKQMDHPLYRWGMTIDLAACTGCSACVTACYAENNIAVVGKQIVKQGREMSWLKISRWLDGPDEQPVTGFGPMLCQHCGNAPCEPVCPVYATYHAEDGLNTMVYNRCVGTRYCSNNCSYKVRRFNWFNYEWPEPLTWQLNPDVTVRGVGVMEKCTFCIQRVREASNVAKDEGRPIKDGDVKTACQASCPADAIQFGNLLDKESVVSQWTESKRGYKVLDFELNTQPAITYLAKVTHKDHVKADAHGEHDAEHVPMGREKASKEQLEKDSAHKAEAH
jgi:anaerobic selenocysteine-containing dehydrogenase/Fe-S-cluster-containing dehydrogenase component